MEARRILVDWGARMFLLTDKGRGFLGSVQSPVHMGEEKEVWLKGWDKVYTCHGMTMTCGRWMCDMWCIDTWCIDTVPSIYRHGGQVRVRCLPSSQFESEYADGPYVCLVIVA